MLLKSANKSCFGIVLHLAQGQTHFYVAKSHFSHSGLYRYGIYLSEERVDEVEELELACCRIGVVTFKAKLYHIVSLLRHYV